MNVSSRFPNASPSFRKSNPSLFPHECATQTSRESQGSKLEQGAQHAPVSTPQGAPFYAGRCLVRVTSYRCGQLCDPDNLAAKYFVDSLRYSGIIADDRPQDIDYQVRQIRVKTRKEEKTEIELIPL